MACFKYQFCNRCESKTEDGEGGNTCPTQGNPYDEKCPRHDKFMAMEDKKRPQDKKRFR